ncbi:MAG: prepilin-type N-terminal cleavage/methylation domain-containing protein [Fimbriimonas sp.]|nr:prepilin-type N-terminal cleavage/methylation domain-containing protein [Fimbriimonas sp.]
MNNKLQNTGYSSRGFTLIELLVVIAIIAILAAILFPVFAQAKDAAKKTVALSNVKQIAIGYGLYVSDNDDTFPNSVTERTSPNYTTATDATQVEPYPIRFKLFPYIKSGSAVPTAASNDGGVWKDPDSPDWPVATTKQWWTVDYGSNSNEANLPGANRQAWYQANPDFGFNETVTTTAVASPSNFILAADAARADGTPSRGGLYPQPWAFDDTAGNVNSSGAIVNAASLQSRLWPRHGDRKVQYNAGPGPSGAAGPYLDVEGGVNIAYSDFHAKWRNINQTWRSYTDNDWRRNPSR